jgi:Ca-activated chloride channel family protein
MSVSGFAASPEQSVKEGNSLYKQEKYDEAVQKFQEAKDQDSDSDIANFNLGAALFKKGDFKESIDAFTQSLNTESSGLEADATYNIANAKYALGSELLNSDLNGAAALYRESLDYYKRAIDLNESNSDAKFNHELVEKELKVLLDQIKNQPEQEQQDEQDKEQDQKKDNQENQESQEQSEGDKEKQEQQDEQQAGDKQKQEEQESTENQMGDPGDDQKEAAGQEEEPPGEMSPEEAKMLLDAFADEESMDNLKKKKQRYNRSVLKDW